MRVKRVCGGQLGQYTGALHIRSVMTWSSSAPGAM